MNMQSLYYFMYKEGWNMQKAFSVSYASDKKA